MTISPINIIIKNDVIEIEKFTNSVTKFKKIITDGLFNYIEFKNETSNTIVKYYSMTENFIKKTNFFDSYIVNKELYRNLLYDWLIYACQKELIHDNSCIMFDVFDDCDQKKIDFHTIVLYKFSPNDEITVIDPNSDEISEKNIGFFNKFNGPNFEILKYKKSKLYCGVNDYDCELDKYNSGEKILKSEYNREYFMQRDCTDIALKICYVVNELYESNKSIDKKNLLDNMKDRISNQSHVNCNISKSIDGTLLKKIHSSNQLERNDAMEKLAKNKDIYDKYGKLNNDIRKRNIDEINDVGNKMRECEINLEMHHNFKANISKK